MMKKVLPFRIGLCINFLIVITSGFTLACFGSCVAINSKLESLGMDVLGKRSNSRRESFGVNNYDTSFIVSIGLPAIIKIQVVVAKLIKSERADFIGSFFDNSLIDVTEIKIPTVPTHLGSLSQTIVDSLSQTTKN